SRSTTAEILKAIEQRLQATRKDDEDTSADFHSTKQGLPLVDSLRSEYITARDQSMVESGVAEGGKNIASFLLRDEHINTNMKPQAKKRRF
ncbi:unnamed protein product, partial [Porites lobata]